MVALVSRQAVRHAFDLRKLAHDCSEIRASAIHQLSSDQIPGTVCELNLECDLKLY